MIEQPVMFIIGYRGWIPWVVTRNVRSRTFHKWWSTSGWNRSCLSLCAHPLFALPLCQGWI